MGCDAALRTFVYRSSCFASRVVPGAKERSKGAISRISGTRVTYCYSGGPDAIRRRGSDYGHQHRRNAVQTGSRRLPDYFYDPCLEGRATSHCAAGGACTVVQWEHRTTKQILALAPTWHWPCNRVWWRDCPIPILQNLRTEIVLKNAGDVAFWFSLSFRLPTCWQQRKGQRALASTHQTRGQRLSSPRASTVRKINSRRDEVGTEDPGGNPRS